MSFVSVEFPIFLALLFLLYHGVASIRLQNLIIVIASYIFYGWWDWRFTPLLFGISLANYVAAILIAETDNRERARTYMVAAIAISVLALAIFKYFNFFVSSAVFLGQTLGVNLHE